MIVRHLLVVLALSSCIRSAEVTCADGRTCPPGNTCDDANARCISPEQIAACTGLGEGSACTFADVPGTCHDGACDPLLCGDGVRTGTEECDGSDLGSADCTTAGFYDPAGLACTQFCTFDTSGCVGHCGDGVINGPELCDGSPPDGTCVDDGFDAGPLACSASCGASFSDCARFGWPAESIAIGFASAIAGTAPGDLWVVGQGSAAWHYAGSWTAFPVNGAASLLGAWAIATDDVWAVGDVVTHWDGSQWSTVDGVPAATYSDVWAAGSDSVFVATKNAGVLAWDGATWQTLGSFPGGAITSLRGSSATDIYAADTTKVWHWNGATWTASLAASANNVYVVDAGDVWISGTIGTTASVIANWNGTSWTQWTNPDLGIYDDVTATAPNDAWVSSGTGMYHFDGFAWTITSPIQPINRSAPGPMIAFSPGSIVGISFDGLVYRYHGQAYADFEPSLFTVPQALWMDAGNDVFVGDLVGHVAHYDGTTWTTATVSTGGISAIFGTGPTNVWSCDAKGNAYRFNAANGTWSTSLALSLSSPCVIWGTAPTDMWMFLGATAQHFNGSTWTAFPAAPFVAASGTSSSDVWAVTQTAVWSWDGTSWKMKPSPASATLDGIVEIAPNHVVVVDTEYAYTWDGTSWTSQLTPITGGITSLAGTASDFLVAASTTELAHFDGTSWSPVKPPPESTGDASSIISKLVATPNMIGMLVEITPAPFVVKALQRTQPWVCEAKETDCTNGVDDDCDGLIDAQDPDCQ